MRQWLFLRNLIWRHKSVALGIWLPLALSAQQPQPTEPVTPASVPGQVIIQSHGDPPPASGVPGDPASDAPSQPAQPVVDATAKADVTDADRSAPVLTSYDLDARMNPVQHSLSMRAQVIVRNGGTTPLKQIALQISSTLHWDSATLVGGATRTRLALAQHTLETDADHTGAESEALLPLPEPLAPGASVSLDLFYSGTVARNAGRLVRLGADSRAQQCTDWDEISSAFTGLRGFGNVLWYPVATPQLFLSEGNALFQAVGRSRLDDQGSNVRLRLSVDYTGGAPAAAYFCGQRQAFVAVPDDPDARVETGSGVARADFPASPLGFRTPSLFVLNLPETFPSETDPGSAAESSSSSSSSSGNPPPAHPSPSAAIPAATPDAPPFLAVESSDSGATAGFSAAADHVAPLLREWLGARPLTALTAIDHNGQPFGDGPLLVGPLAVLGTSPESSALLQSLTHAWVQTGQPWMDEGLAQFFALLWTERQSGRETANAQLSELMQPVSFAEPDPAAAGPAAPGQPLIHAADDLFYRRKAAAVWWMLRGIAGDGNLHEALSAWRTQPASQAPAAEQAVAFEHLLEKISRKDLSWFFNDWVLHDRGLPDLSITAVEASQQPVTASHPSGWVVAITVRNEGGAVADVPVVVHAGANRVENRMRIAGLSSLTQRVLVETVPTSVDVNDGGTPETRASTHTREINLQVR